MHVESAVLGVYMHSLATSRCKRREGCGNFFCETMINFLICRSSQGIYAALVITNCGLRNEVPVQQLAAKAQLPDPSPTACGTGCGTRD